LNPPVWRTFQRIRRRDLILLSGVLLLACMSVIVVISLVWQNQAPPESITNVANPVPQPRPTHTVTFVAVTGLKQFPPVRTTAQAWAPDAQLVSANADWPTVIDKSQVGEPTLWSYRFYSPAKGRLLFVNITPEGQVETIEHVVPVTLPPRPIAADNWAIDSSAALAIWLDNGGAGVLGRNPGMELMIQLRSVNNNPNPVWMVIGLNNQTEEIHTTVIDASQGVVTASEMGS
jgi:hypothetical protein